MGCKIARIEYYLPEKVLTNEELEKVSGRWSADKIEKKVGVRERHIANPGDTPADLAYKVSTKVLQGYDKNKIDFLLLNTQSPDYILPASACILQDKLGLSNNIGALDVNMGCSGFIYGLALARSLINSGTSKSLLLINSETLSKFIHEKDFSNQTIFGDAAAAVIIEKNDQEFISEFILGTDGKGWDKIIVPYGGMRHRYDPQAAPIEDESGNLRTQNHLYMNGTDVFNFTIATVPKVVADVLKKNQLEMGDIDYFIFHQANQYMIEHLRKKMKIPREKFFSDMLHTGNTISASIPIALKDSLDRGVIKEGSRVLLCTFGVGYSWGATILKI